MCRSILLTVLFLVAPLRAYMVTVTQPTHGVITPSGVVMVTPPMTFTIIPDPGYIVADVQTAGVSHGGVTSFTYYGISYDTTLKATMLPAPNSIPETIYVDKQLAADITDGTYSVANRTGDGSDGNAYTTIGAACRVAGVGDTVYIRAGTYSNLYGDLAHNDILWPRVSGTPAAPILFQAYHREPVVIGNGSTNWPTDYLYSISRAPICMRNLSDIIIDGMSVENTAGWFWARGCRNIVVRNCSFRHSKWSSKGTARFIESSFCSFRNCSFLDSSYDCMVLLASDHIVIQDCTFDKGVHTNLSLRSVSWCVIRGNRFRNPYYNDGSAEKLTEMFDQKLDTTDPLGPTYTSVPLYNSTKHNLLEGNFFGYHPDYGYSTGSRTAGIQFSGQKTIIRRNLFSNPVLAVPDPNGGIAGGVGIVWRWGGSWEGWNATTGHIVGQGHEAGFVWGNRVYQNTFYGYDGSKMTFPVDNATSGLPDPPPMKDVANYVDYPFQDKYRFDDNVIANNIFAGGAIVPHINWTFIVMCKGMPVQVFLRGRRAQTTWRNNSFYGHLGDPNNDRLIMDVVDYGYARPQTPAYFNTYQPGNFVSNVQADPCWMEAGKDFHLSSRSPLIDAGAFLTSITSPAGSGATFKVADPNYFFDGYGIPGEQGDLLQVGSQTARILKVDYVTGQVTVDKLLSWGSNEAVALAYSGKAPDIGAYEYVSEPVPIPTPEPNAPPNLEKYIKDQIKAEWKATRIADIDRRIEALKAERDQLTGKTP